jgi:hypothetical protein
MYTINRKLWFGLYVAAFVVLLALSMSGMPTWLWFGWAAAYMLFAVVTDPSPRNSATRAVAGCGCERCDRMRARHARKARRSTDPKNPA